LFRFAQSLNYFIYQHIYSFMKTKNNLYYGLFIAANALLLACNSKSTQEESTAKQVGFTLANTTEKIRTDEPIVLTRQQLADFAPVVAGKIPVITTEAGMNVPSQVDDLNGDGTWDELALVYSFQPNETVTFFLQYVAADSVPTYPKRTQVRFAKNKNIDKNPIEPELLTEETKTDRFWKDNQVYYQAEGPCWENDKVAFRHYFDERNGKDIFGKTTSDLVLEKVGRDVENESYHNLQPWGHDVLKVGNSLGAGSIAVLDNNNQLVRLGKTKKATYKQISNGVVRSIFRLDYEGWQVGNDTLKATELISIWAGKYGYESEVTLSGFEGEKQLVTGIVTVKLTDKDSLYFNENVGNYVLLATHARQSEAFNTSVKTPADSLAYLGMGLLINKNDFIKKGKAGKEGAVTDTYYCTLKATADKAVKYSFFAAWQLSDEKFAQPTYFLELLQNEAFRRSNPVVVRTIQ
jgi:hypothetical protein